MTRFNPWRHLHEHHPDISVQFVDLGGTGCMGLWTIDGIKIERTCNQRERRCCLTHEICHIESGPMPKDARAAHIEERAVKLRTAKLLITMEHLVNALVEHDFLINDHTAESLWVTLPVLRTRMERLTDAEHTYINLELARRT